MVDSTETYCQQCGKRYDVRASAPAGRQLSEARVLARGLKNFVLTDKHSLADAVALARDEGEREAGTRATEAFVRQFRFCLTCRRYLCHDCWEDEQHACLAPASERLGEPLQPANFPSAVLPAMVAEVENSAAIPVPVMAEPVEPVPVMAEPSEPVPVMAEPVEPVPAMAPPVEPVPPTNPVAEATEDDPGLPEPEPADLPSVGWHLIFAPEDQEPPQPLALPVNAALQDDATLPRLAEPDDPVVHARDAAEDSDLAAPDLAPEVDQPSQPAEPVLPTLDQPPLAAIAPQRPSLAMPSRAHLPTFVRIVGHLARLRRQPSADPAGQMPAGDEPIDVRWPLPTPWMERRIGAHDLSSGAAAGNGISWPRPTLWPDRPPAIIGLGIERESAGGFAPHTPQTDEPVPDSPPTWQKTQLAPKPVPVMPALAAIAARQTPVADPVWAETPAEADDPGPTQLCHNCALPIPPQARFCPRCHLLVAGWGARDNGAPAFQGSPGVVRGP